MVALALTVEHEAPPPSDLKTSLDHLTTGWAFNFASWELEALARKAAYGFLSAQRFMTDDERSRFVLDADAGAPGDVVAVREKSKKQNRIVEALQLAAQVGMPAWVEVNGDKAEGVFKKVPDRDEFGADINESLIVELYSR